MENGNKRRDRGGTHVQTLGTMSFTGLELHRKLTLGSLPSPSLFPFSPCTPSSFPSPPRPAVRLRVANGKMFAMRYTGIQRLGNARAGKRCLNAMQWSRNSRGEWPPTGVTLIAQWTGDFIGARCPLLSRISFTKVVRRATRQTNIIKLLLIWQRYDIHWRAASMIIELVDE